MLVLEKGRYRARIAETADDVAAAQTLRHDCFGLNHAHGLDQDAFDDLCEHMLVADVETSDLICCYRIMHLNSGDDITRSYSAQYYNLSALQSYQGKLVEMGRFCIDPACNDPDVLRIAWGAMTQYVDDNDVSLLFGCASFHGTDQDAYRDSFAMLRDKHLAPKRWLPRVKAPNVFRFAQRLTGAPDMKQAMRRMPPLLKTYLMMGGWVSDHAVVDAQMNTLHVFTGVEIRSIPPARKRLLRALT